MKIALVAPYDWSRPGGVRAHVEALAGLLEREHDVRVFAPATGPVPPGVEAVGRAVRVRFNRSVAPVALWPVAGRRVVRALEAYGPDVVHVHEPVAPVVSLAAARFGPRPAVGTFHVWSERDRLYRLTAPVAREVVAGLAERVAVSEPARDYVARALDVPASSFRVVPNGVDVGRFAHAEPLPELTDPERPLVLFVGRLEPRKGLEVAVRAFLRLRRSVPGARLCVVGEGPERERCQGMIPPVLRPDALFVGRVDDDELARYHASADVFVAPATGGESFGVVLLEAMAAGLPVVASDIPGYRTVLTGVADSGGEDAGGGAGGVGAGAAARQGLLVPPMNAFALAEALERVLGDARLREDLVREGRATADRHAWPVVVERLLEIYRSAVAPA